VRFDGTDDSGDFTKPAVQRLRVTEIFLPLRKKVMIVSTENSCDSFHWGRFNVQVRFP
jgi:hypothetical protein